MFDLYIYTDIAKNPPIIEGIENYHHRKIDIKKELKEVKTENRYFYEFQQEIMTIIATLKDLHLTLFASKSPKGIPFSQYIVALPLNFIIKQDKDKQFKIYIELNNLIFLYDEKIQRILQSCSNTPLKTINDMDPFDYIQTISKFRATKNKHAQFTFTINDFLSGIVLCTSPFNVSDFLFIDFEFENNFFLRLKPLLHIPNIDDIEFNKFYDSYIKSKINEINSDIFKFPSIEEVKEEYLIFKNLKKKKYKISK